MSMIAPKFEPGSFVRAQAELFNDGTYPDAAADAKLVGAGDVGQVLKIGSHVETNLFVYLVEFGARVIGCLEAELTAA